MNITVLHGTLSSEPKHRLLPSGDELITCEVTTELANRAASVPVAWLRPSRPPAVATGDAVVVIGHVRRGFFRAASGAASRTEVVASTGLEAACRAAQHQRRDHPARRCRPRSDSTCGVIARWVPRSATRRVRFSEPQPA